MIERIIKIRGIEVGRVDFAKRTRGLIWGTPRLKADWASVMSRKYLALRGDPDSTIDDHTDAGHRLLGNKAPVNMLQQALLEMGYEIDDPPD